ncbi:hypothetical protein R6Z07F_011567 [Ovis aries]
MRQEIDGPPVEGVGRLPEGCIDVSPAAKRIPSRKLMPVISTLDHIGCVEYGLKLRSHSWHHQTSHGKAALWEQEGRELSVILTFTTAKGTTREHTSLTESRGELGMSAWLWKSKDVSLGAGQTQVQTPAPLLTPWDLVLSVGSPVARSISKPRTLLEMQNRLNWNLHFKPDPWGFLHKVKV